jgi:hypothetical protein
MKRLGSGFRLEDLGFRVWDKRFRMKDLGSKV